MGGIKNRVTTRLSVITRFHPRFLADSNRRTRFCRPLTKPLIQGTISSLWKSLLPFCECKVRDYFFSVQANPVLF